MLAKLFNSAITPRLNIAPSKAQIKNTLDGEKRSAMLKIEKIRVPKIKPNCTADVKCPKALDSRLKFNMRSLMIPFPANHNDVQKN